MKHSQKEKVLNYEIDELWTRMKVVQQELMRELEALIKITEKHELRCPHRKHTALCNDVFDMTLQHKKVKALKNQKLTMSWRKIELEKERLDEWKIQGWPQELIDEAERLINKGEILLNEAGSNDDAISQ